MAYNNSPTEKIKFGYNTYGQFYIKLVHENNCISNPTSTWGTDVSNRLTRVDTTSHTGIFTKGGHIVKFTRQDITVSMLFPKSDPTFPTKGNLTEEQLECLESRMLTVEAAFRKEMGEIIYTFGQKKEKTYISSILFIGEE